MAQHYQVELHAAADFEHRTVNGVVVYGLPRWQKESDRRAIRKELFRRLRKGRPDLLHFHDPELIPLGLWWRITRGIPVVYDIHENVGATILRKSWLGPLQRRLFWLTYKIFEKIAVLFFSKLILAEQSYRDFIHKNAETVMNFPRAIPPPLNSAKTCDAIYIGGVTRERGIFQMLEMAVAIREYYPGFRLQIIGPVMSRDQLPIENFIQQNDLGTTVEMKGRMPFNETMQALDNARVGLALLQPIDNYTRSLPTKVMEYMLHEVPFIASDFNYWRNFLGSSGGGFFVDPDVTQIIVSALEQLLDNPEQAIAMGKAGRADVLERLCWEREEEKLLACYRKLLVENPE